MLKVINTYTVETIETNVCQHCGRAIKHIGVILDTDTKEETEVGLTCLEKIIDKFNKYNVSDLKFLLKIKHDIELYEKWIDEDFNVENCKKMIEEKTIKYNSTVEYFNKKNSDAFRMSNMYLK